LLWRTFLYAADDALYVSMKDDNNGEQSEIRGQDEWKLLNWAEIDGNCATPWTNVICFGRIGVALSLSGHMEENL
jgi:hypothetical protein